MANQPSSPRIRLSRALPFAVVFLTSMGVMIVELAASRLVSKYFGTSLYTWTTVIGVILAGISLGNYVGGRLADRSSPSSLAPWLLLGASVSVFLILVLDPLLGRILRSGGANYLSTATVLRAAAAIAVLFLLPSAALGTVSPVIAKLVLARSTRVGNAVGTVYALGAVGSIVGTFLSGFVLVPLLGVRAIMLVVAAVVALLSLATSRRKLPAAIWLALMLLIYLLVPWGASPAGTLYAGYSAYSYMEVKDTDGEGLPPERILVMDGLIHNRYDPTHPDDLRYEYERIFAAITSGFAAASRGELETLTLGGGAFLFPAYLERHFPGRHEVVEIDPEVVRNARRFFDLPLDSTIGIHVADARAFVNWAQGRRRYDIVYLDAFNSYSVPGHLTTLELARSVSSLLSSDGLFLSNLIDIFSLGRFLGAYLVTVRSVFPEVAVYEDPSSSRDLRATFVVACAATGSLPASLSGPDGRLVARRIPEADLEELLRRTRSVPLTDDHAPVENLIAPVFLRSVR